MSTALTLTGITAHTIYTITGSPTAATIAAFTYAIATTPKESQ